MLALIFTRKFVPMIIGSSSRWLRLAGMIARPRATSSRTSSGVTPSRMRAEAHLLGDLTAPRVMHLRKVPSPRATRRWIHGVRSLGSPAGGSCPCGPDVS